MLVKGATGKDVREERTFSKFLAKFPLVWNHNSRVTIGKDPCLAIDAFELRFITFWARASVAKCASNSGVTWCHYGDVIMTAIASQITTLTIVYSTVYSDADQRKHQSSASLAFVQGIHRGPVNSPHKWPVTRKMLPFDDVIMALWCNNVALSHCYKSSWVIWAT